MLVFRVAQAHDNEAVALGQHGFGELRRTLRDNHSADAVFPALFGNPLDSGSGEMTAVGSARNVVVCLLEYEQRGMALGERRPEVQLEYEPRQHGHGDIDDLEGYSGEVDDGQVATRFDASGEDPDEVVSFYSTTGRDMLRQCKDTE